MCQLGARPAPSQLEPQFVIFWILRTMSNLCIRSASRDYAWQSVRHYTGHAVQQWSRFQQAPALRAQMVILDDCSSRCTVLAAVWFSPSLACRSYCWYQHRVDLLTRLVGYGKLRPIDSNADWIMLGNLSVIVLGRQSSSGHASSMLPPYLRNWIYIKMIALRAVQLAAVRHFPALSLQKPPLVPAQG